MNSVSLLKMPISTKKRKNIMLTAISMAATHSSASAPSDCFPFRAKTLIVAVLLYKPPIMPLTKVPDLRNTYLFNR